MDNKNKGFTLIEIIITLTIIVTITTVAVGSYIGISTQKKKEEWRLVKEQIETAAEQYFSSNKYLYEELDDSSTLKGKISVGTLVSKDYLNKVVDPRDKKEVNACTVVEVTINNGKYTGKYKEGKIYAKKDNSSCDSSNKIEISENGASTIFKVDILTNLADTGWYNKSVAPTGITSKLTIDKGKKSITSIVYKIVGNSDENELINSYKSDDGTVTKENENLNGIHDISYTITNNKGKKSIAIKPYKLDNVDPIGTARINLDTADAIYTPGDNYSYNVYKSERDPKLIVSASDETSGISTVKNSENLDAESVDSNNFTFGTHIGEYLLSDNHPGDVYTIYDVAGNASTVNLGYVVSGPINCPTFTASGEVGEDGKTYVSDINVYATLDNFEDKYTADLYGNGNYWLTTSVTGEGLLNTLTADASHKYVGKVTNKYGIVSNSCESETYDKDTTPPSCPTFSYDYTTSKGSTGDGRDGGSANECWFNIGINWECNVNARVKIWADFSNVDIVSADWYTNNGAGNYVDDVKSGTQSITDYWSTWTRNDCPYPTVGELTGKDGCGNWPKMISSPKKNNGWRQGLLVVKDAAGNANYCLTNIYQLKDSNIVEDSKPSCYSNLTYDGVKGDNGWYRSDIKVKKGNNTLCTIKGEGTDLYCTYTVKKDGKEKTCKTGKKKIDKTPPQMTINSGPEHGTCNGKKAIKTRWTATDNLSGIAVEKDYYGYDDTYDWSLAAKLVDRGCTGKKECNYTHTWGPYCNSYGIPGKGKQYKLKWYLKDKAGNENHGMSSSSYTW